tara:strand:+ start:1271 stop:1612 length:342 start_codon:yes stop_codon:yes gene_type:complete
MIGEALIALKPDCSFSLRGDEIIWAPENKDDCPSKEDIDAKVKELEELEPMRLLRIERDKRLTETDWWACGDRMDSMTNEQKIYRKKLRDLPSTAEPKIENGLLTNVTWPEKP